MANTTNLKFACVLILFLILHQQDLYVQGRHLRLRLSRKWSKTRENVKKNVATHHGYGGGDHKSNAIRDRSMHQESKRREEYEVDDFRPTAPGHSPGVGHSINN
ncbi:hypothetical protein RIF29_37072 [Crotalaria pallida]|uniref:Uncharacterized protein n=1 Tax=Crotalaria pallida TaxID=3830 RepID=A0AAN9EBZ3_CROPI